MHDWPGGRREMGANWLIDMESYQLISVTKREGGGITV